MDTGLRQSAQMKQTQTIAPQMREGLKLLAMSIPELRTELFRELETNPVVDDVESSLERNTTSEVERASEEREKADSSDYTEDDDREDSVYTADQDAIDRRQRFFDNQTADETLEDHLLAQLGMTDLDEHDRELAEMLIGELDANGYFRGSLPDMVMITGESEAKLRSILAELMKLDPVGCGATTPAECLLAQLDKIPEEAYREDAREILAKHFRELGEGRFDGIMQSMGMSRERLADVLREIRTLEPHPGRAYAYAGPDESYINPEVHARKKDGRWVATVDSRSMPRIRISKKYIQLLENPKTPKETRDFIRERIARINELQDAIDHREETVSSIAQAIIDAQPGFFEEGLKGLRPLTMQEIADKIGVCHTTVSRTVNNKYMSSPRGTVELRKFFTSGIVTDDGVEVSKDKVKSRLKEIVEAETPGAPLSDDRISELLKSEGFPVARRTVAKYRGELGIPSAAARRSNGA